jgi:hypothetical protein
MQIIDIIPQEVFSITPQQMRENEKMEALMSYNLQELKFIFYSVFHINVPLDILNEPDPDYIRKNIADCLLAYYNALEKNESISLTNLFFKCKKCNHWAYFVFLDDKGICEGCLTGITVQQMNTYPIRPRKEEGIFAWSK